MKVFYSQKSFRSFFFSIALISSLSLTNITLAKTQKAAPTYEDVQVENVTKIIDGDTIKVNIKNYPAIIGSNINIRLYGVDTPPIRTKNQLIKQLGYQAKDFVQKWINKVQNKNQKIMLKNLKRGKYFRIIANIEAEGKNLSKDLLTAGLAVPYFGGKKPDWAEIMNARINPKQKKERQKNVQAANTNHMEQAS